ncbi:hypothetical protein OKE68_10110 [Riemerella anatipestifer]|uniref:Uncharacterized protein n=1 Tax=Riemerella anatipestifer TaxID=34085 RepID=A0AAP3EUP0_RIEAN|nr:hypothetical protein [Riemerella anatipestifer]MCU7569146.1 hypothetical protein [Riemerella anatipestifer]MCW0511614.1 hypothetical protein [Riemerella anatipestifer]MCW0520105.1 hypothetical protein [Riemerella anatipestifer]MCW0524667.1 hypothetical protein [Riemerella anatipestifer]MDR7797638.1 hypothetical protein [Riemerella anatipestifer]
MELVKLKKNSSFLRIKASYLDEDSVELTESEKNKKKRLTHAWALCLNNKYSAHQTVHILMRDHGVSRATAYRDYNWSMQIFGDLDATHLAAERQVLKEAFWNEYQLARKEGNGELAVKALKEYRALFNFDAEENQIDPNKIQAHEYHLSMPRWVYKKMDAMFSGGVVDFNNLEVEDVEYREDTKSEDEDYEDDQGDF